MWKQKLKICGINLTAYSMALVIMLLLSVCSKSYGQEKLNSSSKCNGIHINNLFKFFVWCEVSKSFTRSII